MSEKKYIPEDLSVYIQKLYYEYERYKNILKIIKRDFTEMTDKEWKSSLCYYKRKYQEAKIKFESCIEFLSENYSLDISKNWFINFNKNYLTNSYDSNDIEDPILYNELLEKIYQENYKGIEYSAKDITFQVTEYCNMKCSYCYQHNKQKQAMSYETGKKLIDQILSFEPKINEYCHLDKSLGLILNFIGGEPLLEIELIEKLTKYFIGEAFKLKHKFLLTTVFGICSNGLLHFNNKVQEYFDTFYNFISYSVSIDGNKELHDKCRLDLFGNGTYDRAFLAAKDYKDKYQFVGNKMTLSPSNICYTYEALKAMIDFGHKTIYCNCVYEEGWEISHAQILYKELKKLADYLKEKELLDKIKLSILSNDIGTPNSEDNENWCGGTGKMLAMNYKGDFYPCLRYIETSQKPGTELYIIGNINDGIGTNSIAQKKVSSLKEVTKQSQSDEECLNCRIASGCGWCSAYNYECFDTVNKRAKYICIMHKARVLAVYYYNQLAKIPYKVNCPKEWAIPIIGDTEYQMLLEREN